MEQRADAHTLNARIAAGKANKALARAARAAAAAAAAAYGATGPFIDPIRDLAPREFHPAALAPSPVPLAPLFFQSPYQPSAAALTTPAHSYTVAPHSYHAPVRDPSTELRPYTNTPSPPCAPLLASRLLPSRNVFAYQVSACSSGPSDAEKGEGGTRRS